MNDFHSTGDVASVPGFLVVLRHGETAWSLSGQHTGRTDIPLTEEGEQQALAAGERLRIAFPQGFEPEFVFSSPLRRARRTAELAGFPEHNVLRGIAEWDYGRAEGRTREAIAKSYGSPWNLWEDGAQALSPELEGEHTEVLPSGETVVVRNTAGETLSQVAARAFGVVNEIFPILQSGHNVLLVAHAHILRILTTQWLGVDPEFAKLLRLDTAHFSQLSRYKGDNVIEHWNM